MNRTPDNAPQDASEFSSMSDDERLRIVEDLYAEQSALSEQSQQAAAVGKVAHDVVMEEGIDSLAQMQRLIQIQKDQISSQEQRLNINDLILNHYSLLQNKPPEYILSDIQRIKKETEEIRESLVGAKNLLDQQIDLVQRAQNIDGRRNDMKIRVDSFTAPFRRFLSVFNGSRKQ